MPRLTGWFHLWIALAAGGVLIAVSYGMAANSATGQAYYAVFWLGMLVVFVPVVIAATRQRTSDGTRFALLVTYGAFTFLPKLLRNPGGPLYHDEFAHWRQSVNLASSGRLFQPNPIIAIIARYPGLHIVVATVSEATRLSVWRSAVVVIGLAHLLALLGAALLGEAVFGSPRAGAVVALIYSLNSSFVYFDTEFAYESLALPLLIWCVACLAKAVTTRRPAWAAAAAVAGLGTVPTHHLTMIILVGLLVLIALMARTRITWGVAAVVGAAAVAWLSLVAPGTFAYLAPYLHGGGAELAQIVTRKGGGSRTLFQASTEPSYERVTAFTTPILTGVAAILALATWRRLSPGERERRPLYRALSLFGLLYFPSVPFILTDFGAEGARRSWGFTYLGLAVLVTPIALAALDRLARLDLRAWTAACGALLIAACGALVGNVAAGLDEDYRFPGPFALESDARSVTPELTEMSGWFARNVGTRVRLVTDRDTGLVLVWKADALPAADSPGFPTYDLYLHDGPPSPYLVQELSSSGYTYLIIDERMAYELPEVGVYFEPDEPFSDSGADPITPAALTQYNTDPWTTKIYQSADYAVYRFDFAPLEQG